MLTRSATNWRMEWLWARWTKRDECDNEVAEKSLYYNKTHTHTHTPRRNAAQAGARISWETLVATCSFKSRASPLLDETNTWMEEMILVLPPLENHDSLTYDFSVSQWGRCCGWDLILVETCDGETSRLKLFTGSCRPESNEGKQS